MSYKLTFEFDNKASAKYLVDEMMNMVEIYIKRLNFDNLVVTREENEHNLRLKGSGAPVTPMPMGSNY